MTLYPPKLSNCGNSTPLTFLFPKYPHHKFYFFKKKNCWGADPPHRWWPATPFGLGVVRPPQQFFFSFFFFFKIKFMMRAFWELKGQMSWIATIWKFGEGVKYHILNFGGKSVNQWILKGVKCIFPLFFYFLFFL